ncbi:MAG TPA: transposase [Propionicimonas sp.]|nr:transposase [Propionicimonas sp.]
MPRPRLALDPCRGCANAIRDDLPDAVAVLDAFHVVKLGTNVVDEVRRRVQQDTVGHRGRKDDPLYKIRGLLRHGVEHLSPREVARLETALEVGDPNWEVTIAWSCYQRLRSIHHQRTQAAGKHLAADLIATLYTCPISEVARLGRTPRGWRAQVSAHYDTAGVPPPAPAPGGSTTLESEEPECPAYAAGSSPPARGASDRCCQDSAVSA